MNRGACQRIVDALGPLADRAVIEIGPGHGALTTLLVERARRVVAVEIDPELAAGARAFLPPSRGTVLECDATHADWPAWLATALEGGLEPPVAFASNLPYESGTAILQDWLEASAAEAALPFAVVMLQREVAERVTATANSRAHGFLSALAQSTHAVRGLFDVAPGSFRPVPKVWSRVVRLDRLATPLIAPPERAAWTAFLHDAFAHRRKQLAVSLAGRHGHSREGWRERLVALGHAETARAETLPVSDLVALWRA